MAKSIGEVNEHAYVRTLGGSPWPHLSEAERGRWNEGAKAVALHVLDLMAAADVTPAEAAAQLRAGRMIEEVCAERIQARRDRADLAQNTVRPTVILKPSGCGDEGCVKPYGHGGLCVDSTGQARATKEWLAKGAPTEGFTYDADGLPIYGAHEVARIGSAAPESERRQELKQAFLDSATDSGREDAPQCDCAKWDGQGTEEPHERGEHPGCLFATMPPPSAGDELRAHARGEELSFSQRAGRRGARGRSVRP